MIRSAGQTNYDDLYADILLWLKKGWIDYVAPQLYWEFSHPNAPYAPLLDWWSKHSYGKHCYIGLGIYRAAGTVILQPRGRIPRYCPGRCRHCKTRPMCRALFISAANHLIKIPMAGTTACATLLQIPAVMPPMPWIDDKKPDPPVIQKVNGRALEDSRFSRQAHQGHPSVCFRKDEAITNARPYNMIQPGTSLDLMITVSPPA